jgi:hypothetical protein
VAAHREPTQDRGMTDLPRNEKTWGDVVLRCAAETRSASRPVTLADLSAPPDVEGLVRAGVHPARVVALAATHWLMADLSRSAFLSFAAADDRVDAQPWLEAMTLSAAPRERLFLEALASALFGWLP